MVVFSWGNYYYQAIRGSASDFSLFFFPFGSDFPPNGPLPINYSGIDEKGLAVLIIGQSYRIVVRVCTHIAGFHVSSRLLVYCHCYSLLVVVHAL
jgi:hypothetical protein